MEWVFAPKCFLMLFPHKEFFLQTVFPHKIKRKKERRHRLKQKTWLKSYKIKGKLRNSVQTLSQKNCATALHFLQPGPCHVSPQLKHFPAIGVRLSLYLYLYLNFTAAVFADRCIDIWYDQNKCRSAGSSATFWVFGCLLKLAPGGASHLFRRVSTVLLRTWTI